MPDRDQGLIPDRPKPDDWVTLTYEGIGDPMVCAPSAVAHWESLGWTRDATPVGSGAETPPPDLAAAATKAPRRAGTES